MEGADIGAVSLAGSSAASGDTITVRGSGADIWGAADAFHFLSKAISGDASIVVRVDDLTATNGWAKAGIMLRETLTPAARNVMILMRPDRTISFQYRGVTGGESAFTYGSWNMGAVWLMLARTGNLFEGYESADGATWRKVGAVTIDMPATVAGGLAVTNHDNSALATATFAGFDIVATPPPPPPDSGDWQSLKIGDGQDGAFTQSGGTFTLSGSGSDVWGTSDSFRFAYRTLTGDGELVARVTSFPPTSGMHPVAKAGIMIRSSLAADAAYAFLFYRPGNYDVLEGRPTPGASAVQDLFFPDRYPPQWLKLVRGDQSVAAYISADGVTWTSAGTQAVASGATVYVGLAVCAHDATRTETATFDSVSVTPTTVSMVPPSNVTGQGMSPTTVQVHWQDNSSNETGFEISRATVMDGPYSPIGTTAANATSWTDESVSPNRLYYYRVRSFNGSTFSTYSNIAIVQTPTDSPWSLMALGSTGSGMIFASGVDLFVSSQSSDIWGATDSCHFYARTWTGDVDLVARIAIDFNNEDWGKAGLMIRAGPIAGSHHVFAGMTPRAGAIAMYRMFDNGETTLAAHDWGIGTPGWVRLSRRGDVFTSYVSNDGVNWRQLYSITMTMGSTVYVGFAVTSHNMNWETYAGFYSWQVRSP